MSPPRVQRKRALEDANSDPCKFLQAYYASRGIPESPDDDAPLLNNCTARAEKARESFKRWRGAEADAQDGGAAPAVQLTAKEKYERRLVNNRKSASAARVFNEVLRREHTHALREVVADRQELNLEVQRLRMEVEKMREENARLAEKRGGRRGGRRSGGGFSGKRQLERDAESVTDADLEVSACAADAEAEADAVEAAEALVAVGSEEGAKRKLAVPVSDFVKAGVRSRRHAGEEGGGHLGDGDGDGDSDLGDGRRVSPALEPPSQPLTGSDQTTTGGLTSSDEAAAAAEAAAAGRAGLYMPHPLNLGSQTKASQEEDAGEENLGRRAAAPLPSLSQLLGSQQSVVPLPLLSGDGLTSQLSQQDGRWTQATPPLSVPTDELPDAAELFVGSQGVAASQGQSQAQSQGQSQGQSQARNR